MVYAWAREEKTSGSNSVVGVPLSVQVADELYSISVIR
jgi:hypothetical protein